ncbi:MAG: nucleotide exchange factor GrpE [Bacilli bacterium]|nr:nucleotide exchange factor GrpE [Bacilli bacterium]
MPNKEKEKVEAEKQEEKQEDGTSLVEELEAQLKKANEEVEKWKNAYYRAYADMKNLRNSLEEEQTQLRKYRGMGFVEELLPVLDSFHVVLSNEPTDPNLKNYLMGFKFIYQNMLRALESEGVTEIAPQVGDKFDEATMNAVDSVEEEPINVIKKVSANGYKLHDRLIRPAQVTVSVAKAKEAEEVPEAEIKEDKNDSKVDA